MRSSTLPRRGLALTSVLAILSAAACSDNTQSPTAPIAAPPSIPSAGPNLDVSEITSVGFKILTVWGTQLPEAATVKFMGKDTIEVVDNLLPDLDPNLGSIRLNVPKADAFTACLKKDTKSYGIDVSKPFCSTAPVAVKMTVLPPLTMRAFPIVAFYSQDLNGANMAAGTIAITAPAPDVFAAVSADGGVADLSAAGDGKIVFRAHRPGTYSWCETVAPVGAYLTSPACSTVNLSWDVSTGVIVKHKRKTFIGK